MQTLPLEVVGNHGEVIEIGIVEKKEDGVMQISLMDRVSIPREFKIIPGSSKWMITGFYD